MRGRRANNIASWFVVYTYNNWYRTQKNLIEGEAGVYNKIAA